MNAERYQKVTAKHLARDAYLYVRHATPLQGFASAEAIRRHQQLRGQAVALGWPVERVIVIDSDVGQSGASQRYRSGFRELVRQIELGCVGIVMALEPSRLARNISDWDCLLEACAMSDTLLLHEDGIYDPADSNDRVLLGCTKTTPSTAQRGGRTSAVAAACASGAADEAWVTMASGGRRWSSDLLSLLHNDTVISLAWQTRNRGPRPLTRYLERPGSGVSVPTP